MKVLTRPSPLKRVDGFWVISDSELIEVVSTSPPGGNLVDGSPPVASLFSMSFVESKVFHGGVIFQEFLIFDDFHVFRQFSG